MRLYLPRFYVRDLATNLACLARDVTDAAGQNCDLALFPEQFLTGYHGENDLGRIHKVFRELSGAYPALLCVFGTVTEEGRNRQYVYLAGEPRAYYEKVHLFYPNGEGELWGVGSRYLALKHGAWTIALATCNDVRFPEQIRALKLAFGVDLVLYPALWPWVRDYVWSALLRARAIENGAFVAGCSVAGVDNGRELFDGAGNHVFDPLGEPLRAVGRVYELDRARLTQVTVDTREQYREVTQVDLVEL